MPLEHEKRARRPPRSRYDPSLGVFGDDAVPALDIEGIDIGKKALDSGAGLNLRTARQSTELEKLQTETDSVIEAISRFRKKQAQGFTEHLREKTDGAAPQQPDDSRLEHFHHDVLTHKRELAHNAPVNSVKARQKQKIVHSLAEHSAVKSENANKRHQGGHNLKPDDKPGTDSGIMKHRLRFEADAQPAPNHHKAPHITNAIKSVKNIAGGAVHRADDENVAAEAAEDGVHMAENLLGTAYRHHKRKQSRKVEGRTNKTTALNAEPSRRKAMHGSAAQQKRPDAKTIQKRQIKRRYAKKAHKAQRAGKAGGKLLAGPAVKQTASVGKAVIALSNPKVLALLGIIILVALLISAVVAVGVNIASSIGHTVAAMSHLAEDECIDDAALYYSELEVDMLWSIINVEEEWPGFDEYRFSIGAAGHDPVMLLAYLTAVYHDFTFAGIRHILDEIFAEQYNLQFIPEVEIRTGTEEDEYEWHILNIVLVSQPFSAVIDARMDSGQREHFELLTESRGLRFLVGSPFGFDWLPYVGSHFGWRIHPITGSRNLHLGIDIGQPTGTAILAAHAGTVIFAGDMGNYGLVIFLAGADGIETRYAHCDTLLVSAGDVVEAGQAIATVGSTGQSTGPHLHFEIIRDGRHLNPIFFTANGG